MDEHIVSEGQELLIQSPIMSGEDQRSSLCKIKGSSKSTPFLQCYSSADQLKLKSRTPLQNISDAKPLISTFAKRHPGGTCKLFPQEKKSKKEIDGFAPWERMMPV